jgi:predicted nuclease of predicted toxin-antitoxin system
VAAGAVIITKDDDFLKQAQLASAGPVIVWLRVGNTSNEALRR